MDSSVYFLGAGVLLLLLWGVTNPLVQARWPSERYLESGKRSHEKFVPRIWSFLVTLGGVCVFAGIFLIYIYVAVYAADQFHFQGFVGILVGGILIFALAWIVGNLADRRTSNRNMQSSRFENVISIAIGVALIMGVILFLAGIIGGLLDAVRAFIH